MPRGVPANGVRMTKKVREAMLTSGAIPQLQLESDAEIDTRLRERFEILDVLTEAALFGDARSVIVSGPAGLGKSFNVDKQLSLWDPEQINHTIVKGFIRPTGLYKLLYDFREQGQVIVFDDADSVFFDDISLNLLKSVCDTTDVRKVSWLAETRMETDDGEKLPRSFIFEGTIVFITNLDFDDMIERGHKLAPHMSALVSRSHYIDLAMKTKRDYLVRIRQVVADGMLREQGLNAEQEAEVMNFIEEKQNVLRELSLRMAVKIGNLVKTGKNWRKLASVTCCRVA
jgi:hypothetical protein